MCQEKIHNTYKQRGCHITSVSSLYLSTVHGFNLLTEVCALTGKKKLVFIKLINLYCVPARSGRTPAATTSPCRSTDYACPQHFRVYGNIKGSVGGASYRTLSSAPWEKMTVLWFTSASNTCLLPHTSQGAAVYAYVCFHSSTVIHLRTLTLAPHLLCPLRQLRHNPLAAWGPVILHKS